ncbi:sigma-70 family RNA polymerase sigma factor [Algivirga pacifica]|uniref:Uncharacterized protein n=1 Tax=Algivirga pacifica TaxID=1162670 RepID=A0ABP9D222_9BACT
MRSQDVLLEYQPLLYAIANRMVGVGMDAEDLVQDTMLKLLKVDLSKIEDKKNYLARAITNNCLNYLEGLKKRQEVSIQHLMQQLTNKLPHIELNGSFIDLPSEVSTSITKLMTTLTPSERGVYLMKEVFNYDYSEITEIFEKKKDHCRQLVKRAKDKLDEGKERFSVDPHEIEDLKEKFNQASLKGEMNNLIEWLKNSM